MKRFLKITLIFLVLASVLFAASFLCPANYPICGLNGDPLLKNCVPHHLGPFIVLWIVSVADGHNGLITAIATVFMAGFTWTLWRSSDATVSIADRSNQHFRVTERAYVRMSHVSQMRTGLQWGKELNSGKANVLIEVKNCGRTPARVTAVWLTCKFVPEGQEFPVDFSYDDGDLSYDSGEGYSFVMPSDSICIPQELDVSEAERRTADEGKAVIIVFGYVDYIDQFETHQRAGYGRQYVPKISGNNLNFPAVRAKLNYDCSRNSGEGWDWNNK